VGVGPRDQGVELDRLPRKRARGHRPTPLRAHRLPASRTTRQTVGGLSIPRFFGHLRSDSTLRLDFERLREEWPEIAAPIEGTVELIDW
jgi:hypothetical protein